MLSARGLSFSYPGGVRAVAEVDVDLAPGDLLCVLGPNGAGKSTLVQLLAGLLRPASGGAAIDGRALAELKPRERAQKIAFVPQSLATLPEITVATFVLGGRYGELGRFGRARSRDFAAVRRALELADAHEFEERLLGELSGGQRQRVLIARALARDASVLLVDEPTSSLDPSHQLSIFGLIARLSCEGRAVCVVTHDLNLASQFATRILLMRDGRVAALGTPGEVLCAAVLEPVYGPHLRFGRLPAPYGAGERPFVLSWAGPAGAGPSGSPEVEPGPR